MKGTESVIFAGVVLLLALGLTGAAGIAAFDIEQWKDYLHLFDESRLVSPTPTLESLPVLCRFPSSPPPL